MTAGHGIAHTEVSTPDTTVLHGVQLWIALPADAVAFTNVRPDGSGSAAVTPVEVAGPMAETVTV